MGIKYFFKWYRDSFPHTIKTTFSEEASKKLLLLDINGIVHTSCQKVYKYGLFETKSLLRKKLCVPSGDTNQSVFRDVLTEIDELVQKIDPSEVVLCIDGVAPVSKQIQQRQRRFMTKQTPGGFDPNCISPGTNFLFELDSFLRVQLERRLERTWTGVERIFFMDSLVPGEGEHKLFDFLRSNRSKIVADGATVVIGGNDGDLIMLALLISATLLHKNPVYILRSGMWLAKEVVFLDIKEFKKSILAGARHKLTNRTDEVLVVCDFVVLCFLLGNDFLPQMPLLNIYDGGLDRLLDFFFANPVHITSFRDQGIRIDFSKLTKYFNYIATSVVHAVEHYKTRINSLSGGFSNPLLDCQLDQPNVVGRYYASYSKKHGISRLEIRAYLREIEWIFQYYMYGIDSVDWTTYYPHQFAPNPIEIVNYLETAPNISDDEKASSDKWMRKEPFFQLLCILPPHSSHLLPEPLSDVLTSKLTPFHPSSKQEIEIDCDGKLNQWEGIPILPALDYQEVYKIYIKYIRRVAPVDLVRNTLSSQLLIHCQAANLQAK